MSVAKNSTINFSNESYISVSTTLAKVICQSQTPMIFAQGFLVAVVFNFFSNSLIILLLVKKIERKLMFNKCLKIR